MKYISHYITFVGFILFMYSFAIDTYTDKSAYDDAYHAIDRIELGREESFEAFYALREKYLTNRFQYQNYGVTLLSLGIFLMFLTRKGWKNISSPNTNWKIFLLGFSAALLTTVGYIGDLFLEFARGSYPHWADSLGIPLAGVPVSFMIFFGWAAVNMLGMNGKFNAGVSISNMGYHNINWWYAILAFVTTLITSLCIYDGFFWLVLPGVLWLYFYLSIMAGRKAANK